jgi:hypothetical protein
MNIGGAASLRLRLLSVPAPLDPIRILIEPLGRTRSTPFRAGSLEAEDGKVKVRFLTSIASSTSVDPFSAIIVARRRSAARRLCHRFT